MEKTSDRRADVTVSIQSTVIRATLLFVSSMTTQTQPAITKGSVVALLEPWKVIPLDAVYDDNVIQLEEKRRKFFPRNRFPDPQANKQVLPTFSFKLRQQLSASFSSYEVELIRDEIIVSWSLVDKGLHKVCLQSLAADEEDVLNEEQINETIIFSSWEPVQTKVSFESWRKIMYFARKKTLRVSADDPLSEYCQTVLPGLSSTECSELLEHKELLGSKLQVAQKPSVLAVIDSLRDIAQLRRFAVLLLDPSTQPSDREALSSFPHSCLPNIAIELTKDYAGLSGVALYDVYDDGLKLSWIEDRDSVAERDMAMQRLFGRSCTCVRCRYELAEGNYNTLSALEAMQLGNFFLGKGRPEESESLFRYAKSKTQSSARLMDIAHALGAIQLSRGRFLQAQRLWAQSAREHPHEYRNHSGIALQADKMHSYQYFLEDSSDFWKETVHVSKIVWESPLPLTFISHQIASAQDCQQIIQWAEMNSRWTGNRHYAVPTYDIPLHTDLDILQWFHNTFVTTIRYLLALQFGTTERFYVHDAFCVKYEAGASHNHLNLHTDESTHSFILALNEQYEGGGTYFHDYNRVLRLRQGDMLSFKGDSLLHGGELVTKGTRYILAVFLYHDDDVEEGTAELDANVTRKRKHSLKGSVFSEAAGHAATKNEKSGEEFSFGFKLG